MPIETYEQQVDKFRRENPNCRYCISNKIYGIVFGKVPECASKNICC